MYQSLSSSDLLDDTHYKILCKLYNRYKSAIKVALENANENPIADAKVNELDSILEEVEKYPVSWSYYNSQAIHFSQDFECLIIFYDNKISKYMTDR